MTTERIQTELELIDPPHRGMATTWMQTRGVTIERVLSEDCAIPAELLRSILAARTRSAVYEYDERLNVPHDLLDCYHALPTPSGQWFPVARRQDGSVIIAARNPDDLRIVQEAQEAFGPACLFIPALEVDLQRIIQDFNARDNGRIVGDERTMLAFWRNTMAVWRSRLACYRTDMAKGRTGLNILRWGFGLIALANGLLRKLGPDSPMIMLWLAMGVGFTVAAVGFYDYLSIRKLHFRPPEVQTLVEVTSVVLSFLEEFHFVTGPDSLQQPKTTMLGRLGDFLCGHSTILSASPAYRPRIHLARERNVLAAQRTIGACYRTIASRARTGLSFLRTGVTLTCLGLGFVEYFGVSLLSIVDIMLLVAGLGMIADGVAWYLPVRGEYSETPRCNTDL